MSILARLCGIAASLVLTMLGMCFALPLVFIIGSISLIIFLFSPGPNPGNGRGYRDDDDDDSPRPTGPGGVAISGRHTSSLRLFI